MAGYIVRLAVAAVVLCQVVCVFHIGAKREFDVVLAAAQYLAGDITGLITRVVFDVSYSLQ